jgi:hypothetical protein
MTLYLYVQIHDISAFMYAVSGGSAVYHLFDTKTGLTVCGQRVSKLRVKKRVKETPLQTTPTVPLDRTICKNCVKQTEPVN